MKDIKEAILKATRNNARPYTKEQAAAYAEIFEHVIAAFAENTALSYEEAYNRIVPSFSSGSVRTSESDANILFQPGYHGTPHRFDEFSLDAIGTGEGAQAHGWGLYFAADKKISDDYRNRLRKGRERGQLFEVDLPENDVLLDEDLPLSEQPEPVREALQKASDAMPDDEAEASMAE